MTLPRVFIPIKLNVGQEIVLDLSTSRRILRVLRLQVNSELIIFNNTGGEFRGHLVAINKHQAVVFLEKFIKCNRESPLTIYLGQGISRGEKMDFTIQKSVELGINTITPLFTEHCNVRLDSKRLEKRLHHWQGIAVSAAEQSGRCYIPKVLPGQCLKEWCIMQPSELRLVFDPNASTRLRDIKKLANTVAILVGPEGGLSEKEITLAKQNHFLPITLGPRILRTETAALTAISILQAHWGDL